MLLTACTRLGRFMREHPAGAVVLGFACGALAMAGLIALRYWATGTLSPA